MRRKRTARMEGVKRAQGERVCARSDGDASERQQRWEEDVAATQGDGKQQGRGKGNKAEMRNG